MSEKKHQFALTAVKTNAYTAIELFFFQVKEHNKVSFYFRDDVDGIIAYVVSFFSIIDETFSGPPLIYIWLHVRHCDTKLVIWVSFIDISPLNNE